MDGKLFLAPLETDKIQVFSRPVPTDAILGPDLTDDNLPCHRQ